MDFIILSILVLEVVGLSRLDRKMFGTWLTPFNLLSFPYTAVVLAAYLLAPSLDFVSLYAPSVIIWIVGLFLFWGIGALIGWVFPVTVIARRDRSVAEEKNRDQTFSSKLAIGLAWGIMPLLSYGVYKSLAVSGGLSQVGSAEFRSAYTYGLSAHAVVLAMPLSVFLMGTYKKGRRLQLLTGGMLLVFLFVSQVKGTLLVPIIAALVFHGSGTNSRALVKKVLGGICLSYLLFNVVYLTGFALADASVLGESTAYVQLARHYFYYLSAGVLALGEALRTGAGHVGGSWYLIFSPFINVYRSLIHSGPLLAAGSPRELGMSTDLAEGDGLGTNVYTMFGTLYLYLGPLGSMLCVIAVAFLCYGLFVVCRCKDNVWLTTLHCIIGGWLVFGFFEYYFWHLTFLEVIVYCLILAAVSGRESRRSPSDSPLEPQVRFAAMGS